MNLGIENIDVVILAGGLGSRLRSKVSDRSKVLAEVNGRPFIYYLLDQLCDTGFNRVILCTGYMAEELEDYLGTRYRNINIDYSREKTPLGTGGAVRNAEKILKNNSIIVMNGDSFVDIDLMKFVGWHKVKKANWSLVVGQVDSGKRYGNVKLGKKDEIIEFSEKREIGFDRTSYINFGIYFTHRLVIQTMPDMMKFSLETDYFPNYVPNNVFAYKTDNQFIDIGTPESLSDAQHMFSSSVGSEHSAKCGGGRPPSSGPV